MQTLTPTPQAFTHLLAAAQKSRSVAAENGYLDLLGPNEDLGLPGLDPVLGNDKTLDLLADLATGTRTCDQLLWANLATLVDLSPSWGLHLAARGVQMPDRATVWSAAVDPS